jgi:hypothetical protein
MYAIRIELYGATTTHPSGSGHELMPSPTVTTPPVGTIIGNGEGNGSSFDLPQDKSAQPTKNVSNRKNGIFALMVFRLACAVKSSHKTHENEQAYDRQGDQG